MGFALEKPITDPSQRGLPYDREMQRILSTVVLLVVASCGGEIRSCTVAGAASEVTVSSDSRVAVTDMCLDSLCHPIDFWDGRELIDDRVFATDPCRKKLRVLKCLVEARTTLVKRVVAEEVLLPPQKRRAYAITVFVRLARSIFVPPLHHHIDRIYRAMPQDDTRCAIAVSGGC